MAETEPTKPASKPAPAPAEGADEIPSSSELTDDFPAGEDPRDGDETDVPSSHETSGDFPADEVATE